MYEWLKDYQKLEEEIAYLEYNLEKTEHELWRWTSGDLRDVKLQADSLGAKVEDHLKKIKNELAFKQGQKEKLIQLVSTFKGLDHKILKLKYVDGYTLEEVAEHLSYSVSHIKKTHTGLVKTIKFVQIYQGSL